MTHICISLMDDLITSLTLYAQTMEEDATCQAAVIQKGQYQGEPTQDRIILCVHENDPTIFKREWRHQVDRARRAISQRAPWIRRFTVEIMCNFTSSRETYAEAERIAHKVLMNVEDAIEHVIVTAVADSRGEIPTGAETTLQDSVMECAGGRDDNEMIWAGAVYVQFLTETN